PVRGAERRSAARPGDRQPLSRRQGPLRRSRARGRSAAGAHGRVKRMPRAESREILTGPPPPEPTARLRYGDEPLQFGDLRLPDAQPGPYPLVVFVHGGFWQAIYNLTHAGHLCVALAEAGIASWSLEYRRLGDPGGGWPGSQQDVELGVAHAAALADEWPL